MEETSEDKPESHWGLLCDLWETASINQSYSFWMGCVLYEVDEKCFTLSGKPTAWNSAIPDNWYEFGDTYIYINICMYSA